MNNLTRTVMAIAVAGSLLFGGVAVSSAELGKSIVTKMEQINTIDSYLNKYGGGLPDPDPLICRVMGKVSSVVVFGPNESTFFSIYSMERGKEVHFNLYDDKDQRMFELIKEAWAQDRDVVAENHSSPCDEDIEVIWAGHATYFSVGVNEFTESIQGGL